MFNDNLNTTSGVEMTEAVAMRLFDTLNGLKPKLGCGYFSADHEADLIEASGLMERSLDILMQRVRADRKYSNV